MTAKTETAEGSWCRLVAHADGVAGCLYDLGDPIGDANRTAGAIKRNAKAYAEALVRERVLVAIDELMGEGWLDFVESIPPKRRSIFHTNAMRVRARILEGSREQAARA